MVAEAIKKYRQDEGELESSSLLQYKSSTDKFTVGFITNELVMENVRATNAFKYSADKYAVGFVADYRTNVREKPPLRMQDYFSYLIFCYNVVSFEDSPEEGKDSVECLLQLQVLG